jgi:DoxX
MSLADAESVNATPREAIAYRVAIGCSTLLMIGLSWPLWVDNADFPRVPFVSGLPVPPVWSSWILASCAVVSIALATVGVAWRVMMGVSVAILVLLVLQDQNRFQPWIYQYSLSALALACLPPRAALGFARLFVVAMYVHSALSKWDESFARFMGPSFLSAALKPFGVDPRTWPPVVPEILVRLMPAGELAVGLGLCVRKTRRWALVAAVFMHAALIWILCPMGLNQSTIVLIWNAAVIVEVLVLFSRVEPAAVEEPPSRNLTWVRALFAPVVLLPLGERWSWFDAWPSFAYYSSHLERATVRIQGDDSTLPLLVRRLLNRANPRTDLERLLRLTDWSREVRGVPIYPQNRVANGMAEWLAARSPESIVRIVHWGPVDRRGQRTSAELIGRGRIAEYGERYWINAHPGGIARENAAARQPRAAHEHRSR